MGRDWDDAYANGAHIPGGVAFPERWAREAAVFRDGCAPERFRGNLRYGPHPREVLDLFLPDGAPRGLLVIVHGGYWLRFSQRDFSHLAAGGLYRGWAVAMPGYPLAPEVSVRDITRSIAAAISQAGQVVRGPIRLTGHSAGGHLVVRQVCADTGLDARILHRVARVVSISGVHDLRPLLMTAMKDGLHLDDEEAAAESPVLLRPLDGADVHVWVGDDERPEFVRQSTLLANIWSGFETRMAQTIVPGRHHFDIIEGLSDGGSDLVGVLLED